MEWPHVMPYSPARDLVIADAVGLFYAPTSD